MQSFKNKSQLYYRCPKSEKFPLPIVDMLVSDKKAGGERFCITFETKTPDVLCKSYLSGTTKLMYDESIAIVLCKSLIIMRMNDGHQWLLYLYSDLAFFTFNHPHMEFGNSFHLKIHGQIEGVQRHHPI